MDTLGQRRWTVEGASLLWIHRSGGTNLAEILVSRGLARTKGITANLPTGQASKAFSEKLHALESDA